MGPFAFVDHGVVEGLLTLDLAPVAQNGGGQQGALFDTVVSGKHLFHGVGHGLHGHLGEKAQPPHVDAKQRHLASPNGIGGDDKGAVTSDHHHQILSLGDILLGCVFGHCLGNFGQPGRLRGDGNPQSLSIQPHGQLPCGLQGPGVGSFGDNAYGADCLHFLLLPLNPGSGIGSAAVLFVGFADHHHTLQSLPKLVIDSICGLENVFASVLLPADGRRKMLKESPEEGQPLTDVQARKDTRNMPIDKVGVKRIRHPIVVKDRSQGNQRTIANINMYVNLPHHFKGTHMSRFLEVLAEHDGAISVENLPDLLRKIQRRLAAEEAHIDLAFPYFINKKAPVSGVSGLMDYDVRFSGVLRGDRFQLTLGVTAPVTSLCPCSKEISDYGAHNQRSQVTVTLRCKKFIWVEEVIEIIERNASCELYAILKRPDEKYVTERAYEQPKFVEDMVRGLAVDLDDDPRVLWYTVESENFESIHNHSAYAFIEGRKES